jgi:hypothetical protein
LPSLLPTDSSIDFSAQFLPLLLRLKSADEADGGGGWAAAVWRRCGDLFHRLSRPLRPLIRLERALSTTGAAAGAVPAAGAVVDKSPAKRKKKGAAAAAAVAAADGGVTSPATALQRRLWASVRDDAPSDAVVVDAVRVTGLSSVSETKARMALSAVMVRPGFDLLRARFHADTAADEKKGTGGSGAGVLRFTIPSRSVAPDLSAVTVRSARVSDLPVALSTVAATRFSPSTGRCFALMALVIIGGGGVGTGDVVLIGAFHPLIADRASVRLCLTALANEWAAATSPAASAPSSATAMAVVGSGRSAAGSAAVSFSDFARWQDRTSFFLEVESEPGTAPHDSGLIDDYALVARGALRHWSGVLDDSAPVAQVAADYSRGVGVEYPAVRRVMNLSAAVGTAVRAYAGRVKGDWALYSIFLTAFYISTALPRLSAAVLTL